MTAKLMKEEKKEAYEKPVMEVIEMEIEGILCASSEGGDFEPGDWTN